MKKIGRRGFLSMLAGAGFVLFGKGIEVMSSTKKKTVRKSTNRISKASSNGKAKSKPAKEETLHKVEIPPLQKTEMVITLKGDRPLMVNNKMNVAEEIAEQYSGSGKTKSIKKPTPHVDVQYARAFYVLPSSKKQAPDPKALYGIPGSGIKKCVDAAIRTTGITDNTTIGLISKSFFVMTDEAGLCKLRFKRLERDVRAVNIGSGQKTVPQMRHRPMFHGWEVDVRVSYNPVILSPETIVNLFMHAGQYIGLHEMRAQKKQGECGGFIVATAGKKGRTRKG